MSNWMQKLDRKMGAMLEQIDEAGHPMTQVMTFEAFRRADEDAVKAERLLRARQDAAGLDYEPPAVSVKVKNEPNHSNDKTCCEMTPVTC
jgi:hypothetical protein